MVPAPSCSAVAGPLSGASAARRVRPRARPAPGTKADRHGHAPHRVDERGPGVPHRAPRPTGCLAVPHGHHPGHPVPDRDAPPPLPGLLFHRLAPLKACVPLGMPVAPTTGIRATAHRAECPPCPQCLPYPSSRLDLRSRGGAPRRGREARGARCRRRCCLRSQNSTSPLVRSRSVTSRPVGNPCESRPRRSQGEGNACTSGGII